MVVHPVASPLLAKCLVRTFPEQWHSTRVGSRTQLLRWRGGGGESTGYALGLRV